MEERHTSGLGIGRGQQKSFIRLVSKVQAACCMKRPDDPGWRHLPGGGSCMLERHDVLYGLLCKWCARLVLRETRIRDTVDEVLETCDTLR